MPRFSIVVPVYNVVPYLGDCLDSVRAQAFHDWESLCVDDGSFDGSGAVIDGYARLDSRVRVVHQRNVGLPGARNRALDAACGDYVVFLDSDDLLASGILAHVANLLTSDEVDAVTWRHRVFHDGERIGDIPSREPQTRIHTGKNLLEYLITNKIAYGFACSFCIRRACVGKLRFRPVGYVEDMMFVADMASEFRSLIETDKCGFWYRRRAGQITSVCDMKVYRARQRGWAYAFERYGVLCGGGGVMDRVSQTLVLVVQDCLMQNTVALCCYGQSSGLGGVLRAFFRNEPELKPPLGSLKAILCRMVATPGLSFVTRMGLRQLGRALSLLRRAGRMG